MEMVRVTLLSHTLLVLAVNQVFLTVHLTNHAKVLHVVLSKMPTSFVKVNEMKLGLCINIYSCTLL